MKNLYKSTNNIRNILTIFFLSAFCFLLMTGCNKNQKEDIKRHITNEVIPMLEFESKVDSLEWVLETGDSEAHRSALSQLSWHYLSRDLSKALSYAQQLEKLALKQKSNKWLATAYENLGNVYIYYDIDSAMYYFNEAGKLFKKINNQERIAANQMSISSVYNSKLQYDSAIHCLQKALVFYENEKNYDKVSQIYSNLAVNYMDAKNFKKSQEYLLKAVEIQKNAGNKTSAGVILLNLSILLENQELFDEAIECGIEAVETLRGAEHPYYLCRALLATFSSMSNNNDERAIDYLNEAALLAESLNISSLHSNVYINKAIYYLNAEDWKKAKDAAIKCFEYVDSTNFGELAYLNQVLVKVAIHNNDKENALYYFEKYRNMMDESNEENWMEKLSEMEIKYETEKKQLKIEKQQQINKLQRNYFLGGIAVCILIVALLWFLLRSRNRQKETLAEMNTTKDKFFTIISHDLKNPAVAQREALQLLLENAKQWDAEKLEHYCHGLMKSADGLVDLLYNLLNWAQLQTGRMPYKPVLYDIAADMRETTLSHLKGMAEHKGIELVTKLPNSALVTGDINMLKTVVRNLIDNAIKFTPKGGTVTLEISQGTGRKFSTPSHIISVSDTGIGMTEEQRRHLIRNDGTIGTGRKFSTSTRGTAGETGTGLGLTVCKELLEKHGSTLHIESEPGKGSTFWFEIP